MIANSLGSLRKGDTLYCTKGTTLIEMEIVEVKPRGRAKPYINLEEKYPIIGCSTNLHAIAAVNKETGETRTFHLSRLEEDYYSQVTWGTGLFVKKEDAYRQVYKESMKELGYCEREITRCLQKVSDMKKARTEAKKRIRKYAKYSK